MNPFWRAYFSKGLVQPPTRKRPIQKGTTSGVSPLVEKRDVTETQTPLTKITSAGAALEGATDDSEAQTGG